MRARYLSRTLLITLLLALAVDSGADPRLLADQSPGTGVAATGVSTTVVPWGDLIDVAVTGSDEEDPAVAMCASGQYLVVYVLEDDIYGQRLTAEGALLGGPFLISGGTYPGSQPDVACEWTSDTFVVVWQSEFSAEEDDIFAQAVYGAHQGGGSQLKGVTIYPAFENGPDERYPAIACNSADQTCLLVYRRDFAGEYIFARRIEVSATPTYLTHPQPVFAVSPGGGNKQPPDVAWAAPSDQFMIVWGLWGGTPTHWLLRFRPIWDTHQAGSQDQGSESDLVDNSCGANNDQHSPAIAYSRGAGEYLVTYEYDSDDGDQDVYALRLQPDGSCTCPFSVAGSSDNEEHPAVAYSGGPEHHTDQHGNPQFLVVYRRAEGGTRVLVAQAVKDRADGSGIDLDGTAQELSRSTTSGSLNLPDVTGSAGSGRYLVAWRRTADLASPNKDVLARMASPYGGVLSHAGISFVSGASDNSYEYANWGGVRMNSDGYMTAPVHLPSGATVTGLTLYYNDASVASFIQLSLYQRIRGSGGMQIMATANSVGSGGFGSTTDSSIISPTVNNASYDYVLRASWTTTSSVELYGAKITYIPNADAPIGSFRAATTLPNAVDLTADLATGGSAIDWAHYTVAGSNFHPAYSTSGHSWDSGGGRYVSSGPTTLIAPLNLIHGKRIHRVRFTYYDDSLQDPDLWLYRVDRQGSGSLLWQYDTPPASGGYFTAVSPRLDEVVDNHNYAYYFRVFLGTTVAGADLQAMEVEISYVSQVYLPLILRNY